MSTHRSRPVRAGLAMLLVAGATGCCDPWPDEPATPSFAPAPPSSPDKYLVAIPNELDVHIDDHTKDVSVMFVGKVFNRWRKPLEGEAIKIEVKPPVAGFDMQSVTTAGDTAKLVIRASATQPAGQTITVNVAHASSGLTIDVPVHVMYNPETDNGVHHPSPTGEYPAAGLASGAGTTWRSNILRAFVRRARFEKFNPNANAPSGDVASGTVLSPLRIAWRDEAPWANTSGNMSVPGTAESTPAVIPILPVLLANADPATGTDPNNFVTDLQGGADLIDGLLIGARVEIGTVVVPGPKIEWDWYCADLEDAIRSSLIQALWPAADRLVVYMVTRSNTGTGDLPLTCPVGSLPNFLTSQAIFLPAGPVESQSFAHEIAHALSLTEHVIGLDYMDNNLMAVPVSGAERLRDRLTVGQTFRAAFDVNSWIVRATRNKSNKLDCLSAVDLKKCPLLSADISVRKPS